ncbi:MAG: hypothetical protein ACXVA9_06430 [Bdellovibrionales bacterium]
MSSLVRVLFLATALFAAPLAFAKAPTWTKDCAAAGKKSTDACQKIHDVAKAGENADAAKTLSAMPKNGKGINPEAQGLQQAAQAQAARLTKAQQDCQKEQDDCKQKCDQEESDRKPHEGKTAPPPPTGDGDPMGPPATAQSGQVDQAKENTCMAPIAAMMADLGKGAADAANAANQAGNSAGQTPGMPPIPPMPSSGDKTGTATTSPTSNPLADQMACSTDPAAATLSKCTDTLVAKCTPGLSSAAQNDPTCDKFTARFCNANPTSSTPDTTSADTTPTVNADTNRPGSGVGTSYCNTAIAKNFCQAPGRAKCATCQNYRATTSDDCKNNPSSCQTTQFSASCPDAEPILATTPPSGTSPTGGGDSMGGGGGGGGDRFSPAGPAGAGNKEGIVAGKSDGPNMNMAVSEGGGSGSSYDSSNDSFASKYRIPKFGGGMAGAKPASASASRVPASTDVANTSGPSLFNISSMAIQNMCNANRLRHCGRN